MMNAIRPAAGLIDAHLRSPVVKKMHRQDAKSAKELRVLPYACGAGLLLRRFSFRSPDVSGVLGVLGVLGGAMLLLLV
jgi:hypothetical protein